MTIWKGKFIAYRQTTKRGRKALVRMVRQFKVQASTSEQAIAKIAGTIPGYRELVYPSFAFGGPKQAMSQLVSSAIRSNYRE